MGPQVDRLIEIDTGDAAESEFQNTLTVSAQVEEIVQPDSPIPVQVFLQIDYGAGNTYNRMFMPLTERAQRIPLVATYVQCTLVMRRIDNGEAPPTTVKATARAFAAFGTDALPLLPTRFVGITDANPATGHQGIISTFPTRPYRIYGTSGGAATIFMTFDANVLGDIDTATMVDFIAVGADQNFEIVRQNGDDYATGLAWACSSTLGSFTADVGAVLRVRAELLP